MLQPSARPSPGPERRFERFVASVGVEIAWAFPRQRRRLQFDADAGQRRDRVPEMAAGALEFERARVAGFAVEPHAAFQAMRPRDAGLIDPDIESAAVPGKMAAT